MVQIRYNTVKCPHCHKVLGPIGRYRPGVIRCGVCGKPFNLR